MADEASKKYYSVEEAQGLVEWLEELFRAVQPMREEGGRHASELRGLEARIRSNGGSSLEEEAEHLRRSLDRVSKEVGRKMAEATERGIIVRDIERGLVDFPSLSGGREVYLCWQPGEAEIGFWHEVDTGFAGRRPL